MTDTRLSTLYDQRDRLYRLQRGRCAECGRIYRSHQEMEMAHCVAETKANISRYGFECIDHDRNKRLVCRDKWKGMDCNARQNMAGRPVAADRLMASIKREIEK